MNQTQSMVLDYNETTLFESEIIELQTNENLSLTFDDVAKRGFDIVFSLIVIVVGLPIYIIIGTITYFTSDGPILFFQRRTGMRGKKFNIYKFRSMYVGTTGKHSNGKYDSRITPWGYFMRKTRIDELPQFYNVLRGEMSIVGPRPLADYDVDMLYSEASDDFIKILSLKPGITSMGQLEYGYARSQSEIIDRMKYDLEYINKKTFWFDCALICKTVFIMFGAKGK
jgi:lipopolysaccharide/colanic/teichoic acid biosynthesis glycosyltransferase